MYAKISQLSLNLKSTHKPHGRKPGLVDSKIDSRLKGRGFESCLILDGNGVKAMQGRFKYTILVHSTQY